MVKFYGYRKNRQWVVTWRSTTGSVLSQGFDSEREARAFEQSLQLIAEKERALLKKRKREQVNRQKITVKELVEQYLASQGNPVTRKQNGYHAAHIVRAFGQRQAARLAPDDAFAFIAAQQARGVARITANRRLCILRAALNWAVSLHILQVNPLRELRLPRAEPQRLDPPTRAEAKALFDAAAPHVQRVIVLGLHTGARIGPSELFQLRWADIDLEAGVLWMPCARKNRKREARREIPISPHILPILKKWQREDAVRGYEYVIHYRGKPVTSISRAWHSALKKAGITRRIRPYDLRHAFASNLLAEHADYKSVAELMWHDVAMLLRTYQHIDRQQKRQAVEKMPNILKLPKNMSQLKSKQSIEQAA